MWDEKLIVIKCKNNTHVYIFKLEIRMLVDVHPYPSVYGSPFTTFNISMSYCG